MTIAVSVNLNPDERDALALIASEKGVSVAELTGSILRQALPELKATVQKMQGENGSNYYQQLRHKVGRPRGRATTNPTRPTDANQVSLSQAQ